MVCASVLMLRLIADEKCGSVIDLFTGSVLTSLISFRFSAFSSVDFHLLFLLFGFCWACFALVLQGERLHGCYSMALHSSRLLLLWLPFSVLASSCVLLRCFHSPSVHHRALASSVVLHISPIPRIVYKCVT